MAWLPYVGDAMWILATALIASTSKGAMARIPAHVRVPMQRLFRRQPAWRAPRNVAFGFSIGLALVVGLGLLVAGRLAPTPQGGLLILLIRAFTAPLFVLAHLSWLRGALRILEDEGALKP